MIQTHDGYLWVGTLGGLARFDGLRFTRFDVDNTPRLKSNRIVSLFEDSHGNLWIGTEKAGIVVVGSSGVAADLPVAPGSAQGRLVAACEDATGAVWLHTADVGTDELTGRLLRFGQGGLASWQWAPSRCRALIAEAPNVVWVGTDTNQIALSANADAAAKGMLAVMADIRLNRLDFLLASRTGGYWRLADGRVQKLRGAAMVQDLGRYPWFRPSRVISAAGTAVCEDQQGNLVAGTSDGEVYWSDAAGGWTRIGSELGLPHSSVLSLCVDREGCLWVGTNGRGLFRVRRQAFGVLAASAESVVQSVCEDGAGGLWIGYHEERIDHQTGGTVQAFTNILAGPVGMRASDDLLTVLRDREGRVWAGFEKRGLFVLQGAAFEPAPGADLLNQHISALYQDRQGDLWVGTGGGLGRWNGKDWRTYFTLNGLSANAVQAIAQDAEGNLWVGTAGGGLNWMRNGQFTWFTRTNGLPSDDVTSLLVDQEGVVWAGTGSGLAWREGTRWTSFTREDGLPASRVGFLLEDGRGYLWMGSGGGLIRVSKKALRGFAQSRTNRVPLRTYGEADGLPAGECTFGSQPAACRTRDGKLWFPTISGLAFVDPAELHPNTNQLPVAIESVSLGGRALSTNTLRAAPLRQVVVPAGQQGLEIHYTSLNLAAADRALFRYRMEGHERDWSPASEARSAYYGKLPPGRWVFHVTACNEDGIWNQEGCRLAVRVLPPFWQRWWFVTASAAGLLFLVAGSVHYLSTQKLQRQLAILRQHEALENERGRIARDLHDQLGANLTQVALLAEMAEGDRKQPADVEAHAQQIAQTARETTRALDEIVWTVNPANDSLDGLVNYLCKYAQEYLDVAGLRYRLEAPAQLPAVPISPELRHNVFLVAKEAINNVLKHARASSVWLRLRLAPGRLELEIEDDGRGLSPEDQAKGRSGLLNMRRRMEEVGGCFAIGPGPAKGTVVRISAPIGKT
jgi:ligand-binding sensor domain-containing protein/signal transduction histidine kinase